MNGFGGPPIHGISAEAGSHLLRVEARDIVRPSRVKGSLRYAVGKRIVLAGSVVMGLRVDIPAAECAQPS